MIPVIRKTSCYSIGFTLMAVVFLATAVTPSVIQAQEELTPIPMITGIEMLKVGDTVPDFTVSDLADQEYSIKEALASKKGVMIFFWSIFCEPCKAELPVIQALTEEYREKGLDVVGVAIDGAPMKEAIGAFIKQEGYSFSTLIDELNPDESFKVSDPYGVAGTPTLYIVDRDGIVRFAKVGRASREELEDVIKQVL